MVPVAPCIVNDVSSVSMIAHDIHFAWQAQYLVRFGKVHVPLFVAGAAFGEVHASVFVAGTTFGEVHV